MNIIKVYEPDGALKYTFYPKSNAEGNGNILEQHCFLSSDDTGAELEGGDCDFSVYSESALEIFRGYVIKYFHGDTLMCVFFVDSVEKISETQYRVTGIDSIAKLSDACYYGVFVTDAPIEKYLSDNVSENIGIKYEIDSSLENFSITASYPSGYNEQNASDITMTEQDKKAPTQQSSMRDLFQQLAFGYGIRFETFKTDGIKISLAGSDYTVNHSYSESDVFAGATVAEKSSDIGIVNLYKQSLLRDNTSGSVKNVRGYFKINGGQVTKIDPFTETPVLKMSYIADGLTKEYQNDLTGNVTPKSAYGISSYITLVAGGNKTDIFPDGNVRTSHYFTSVQNYDGSFSYQIDLEKLKEVTDYIQQGYSANPVYTDENGTQYALGNIGWRETFIPTNMEGALPYTVSLEKSIIYDKNKSKNNVILPFYTEETPNRVDKYFSRTKQANFKVKYSGENLGEIVSLTIENKTYYCSIKSMDFNFSYNNIFCDIVADVLSEEESSKVIIPNKYNSHKYGTSKYV